MSNILITSAGRRVSLVRIFKTEIEKRNLRSKVFTADANPTYSSACQVSERAFLLPLAREESFINQLLACCRQYSISVVIPTNDLELKKLAVHKEDFQSEGIFIMVPDHKVVSLCRDKRETPKLFKKFAIQCPSIYPRDKLNFPCFAKPFDGSSSTDLFLLNKKEELREEILLNEKLIFMQYIDKEFEEYTVDMYCDKNGTVRCVVPRKRIEIRSGEVSKSVTNKNFVYQFVRRNIPSIEGARGCITMQLFYNQECKKIFGIEINPRFGGGFPLTYASGANYPGWILDEYICDKNIPHYDEWKDKVLMLRYDSEVFSQL